MLVGSALVGLEGRVSGLEELVQQTKKSNDQTQQLNQILRTKGVTGVSSATTGYKDTQRWLKEAVSDVITIFSGGAATPASLPAQMVRERDLRLRVRIESKTIRQHLRKATEVEIRERLNGELAKHPELQSIRVTSFTQLQSGDVELMLERVADVERLCYNETSWVGLFGEGSHILRETFTVLLHGIKTASIKAIGENWERAKQILSTDNMTRFPTAQVAHVGWLSKSALKTRTKTSIIVAFTTPEDANRTIELGMSWDGSHHQAELYQANCKLLQCHRCQHYGHVETQCHAPVKCPKCADGHKGRYCPYFGIEERYRCAVCDGPHSAHDPGCESRIKAMEAVETAKANRPAFFAKTKADPPAVAPLATATATAPIKMITNFNSGGTIPGCEPTFQPTLSDLGPEKESLPPPPPPPPQEAPQETPCPRAKAKGSKGARKPRKMRAKALRLADAKANAVGTTTTTNAPAKLTPTVTDALAPASTPALALTSTPALALALAVRASNPWYAPRQETSNSEGAEGEDQEASATSNVMLIPEANTGKEGANQVKRKRVPLEEITPVRTERDVTELIENYQGRNEETEAARQVDQISLLSTKSKPKSKQSLKKRKRDASPSASVPSSGPSNLSHDSLRTAMSVSTSGRIRWATEKAQTPSFTKKFRKLVEAGATPIFPGETGLTPVKIKGKKHRGPKTDHPAKKQRTGGF